MKTNTKLPGRLNLKRKFEQPNFDAEEKKASIDYTDDDNIFDPVVIRRFPAQIIDGRIQMPTGARTITTIYDSLNPTPYQTVHHKDKMLLNLSNLAICFYNMMEGTHYFHVKLLRATTLGYVDRNRYITFQAFSSQSRNKRLLPVTFQTKIHVSHYEPRPRFEIIFVRIKPHHKSRQTSASHDRALINQQRLYQLLTTYDSSLDSRYSLSLYLSQLSLVNHYHVLNVTDAKHDIEMLKVLKLVHSAAKVPTYLITFEAPLLAETEGKTVEFFETEIKCMPTIFPTAVIELKSDARMIPA